MSRKQRRKQRQSHMDEGWLIPYADMLTLLFALFVVLASASTVDAERFQQITESIGGAFYGGEGIMEHTSPVPPVTAPETDDEDDGREEDDDEEEEDRGYDEELARIEQEMEDLAEVEQTVNAYIEDNELQASLETSLTQDGLLITIADSALFDSGSAEVKDEAEELAHEISELLVTDPPRHVAIDGHTDDVPIYNEEFRSNWDLSAMRAINFMKILLENEDLEPHRFSASGYGEHRPVASNESAEGRAENRRVEVLILPRYVEDS